MKYILKIIGNKYLLISCIFLAWMLFFDQKDFFSNLERRKELSNLKQKKHYYQQEIDKTKQELADFQGNSAAIEKFAREHYLLKKDGEDVYIVEDTLATK